LLSFAADGAFGLGFFFPPIKFIFIHLQTFFFKNSPEIARQVPKPHKSNKRNKIEFEF